MKKSLLPSIEPYLADRLTEFYQIPGDRKNRLFELTRYAQQVLSSGATPQFVFICTHNSRRSHLSQIWAKVAATHFGFPCDSYSGGTEATAFNPRAVSALRRAGFEIPEPSGDSNPRYQVRYLLEGPTLECFSKRFQDATNPQRQFCAVMTCTDADEKCPVVLGCDRKISLPFEDPKAFDGTADESKMYDERCRQIACELLYAFSQVA